MSPSASNSVALVHDFLVTEGGAERCAIEFSRMLPAATVYTSFYREQTFGSSIPASRVRTWPLQRVFGPTDRFRSLLPAYPLWFSTLDLREARLVLSSSIAFSNAVRTNPVGVHVSYIYTPMRYAWDLDTYLDGSSIGRVSRFAARLIRAPLKQWDIWASRRPDVLVSISETVRRRVAECWGRESEVIYPPVDTAEIRPGTTDEGFLLVAARLLAYRRIDLVVEAATRLGRPLVVIGDGPERRRLETMAGPSVRFLGHVPRETVVELMRTCHAYLVPGIEDFGIAPVEAMAAGRPVVAFKAGGLTETVVEGETGVFFAEPSADALIGALDELDRTTFDRSVIRARAETFDTAVFRQQWQALFRRLGVPPSLYSAE